MPFSSPVGSLSAKDVTEIHRNADVNKSQEAMHHTLGIQRNQASPGSHIHDGTDSEYLLAGVIFTGSRGSTTAAVIQQIMNALVRLGAVNSTTP